MTLTALQEEFSVCKLHETTKVDLCTPFTFLSITDDEISLVCPTPVTPDNAVSVKSGWRALKIAGDLNFELVGIISRLSDLLAASGISVFVISTYNTDYILVQAERFQAAIAVLTAGGHRIFNA